MSTVIGYARVSTCEQNPDAQTEELRAAGAVRVFVDHGESSSAHRRRSVSASPPSREPPTRQPATPTRVRACLQRRWSCPHLCALSRSPAPGRAAFVP